MVMDGAPHNNSSLLPILLVILSSLFEWPVVDVPFFVELTLWSGWTSEPCTSAYNEPLLTLQIRPYSPAGIARFDKEVAISSSFKFENLREGTFGFSKYKWSLMSWLLPLCPCWPARCSYTPPHTRLESPWLLHWGWLSDSRGASSLGSW